MRSFTPITLLYLTYSSIALALPTKLVLEIEESPTSADTSSLVNNTTTPCTPAELALSSGIAANIADQQNELAAVSALGNILSENPLNTNVFAVAQSSLLNFVTIGIAIRQNNQKIAPVGNAAIPGLAIVANAQMVELNLTMSLGMGGVDVVRDNTTVEMLKKDFEGGIVQNMMNMMAVSRLSLLVG